MAANTQKYRINRVVDANGNLVVVHPETEAEQVLYSNTIGTTAVTNVDQALGALASLATSSGVTGVKGAAESTYRKGNVNLTPANIGAVASNDAITAGTFTKVNVDTKGLVTGGSQATLDDIPDGSTRKLSNYIPTSQKGANGGVATLGNDGKVPSSQLPSYVDDVLEYDNLSGFPTTGSAGKIYVDKQTNKTYRWSGSGYTEISASLALGETSSTAYAGDKGKANADAIANIESGATVVGHATNADQLGGVAASAYAKTADLSAYQFKRDLTLSTTDKSIVGAINEVYEKAAEIDGVADTVHKFVAGTLAVPKASKLEYARTISLTGDATGSTTFDGSSDKSIAVTLANSGVVAGQYSAVNVNAKGIVTGGGKSIEWGASGQTAPSENLMVGGLFFELVE